MNMKKLLIPVAVILVCALVLFGANAALSGAAETNRQELFDIVMQYVLPDGTEYEAEEYTGTDESIVGVYRTEQGAAVEMVVGGFAEDIHMVVGVLNDGSVYGLTVLDSHETYGLGQSAKSDWDFLCSMLDSQGDLTIADVDSVTGATITSSASEYVTSAGGGALTGTADGFMGPITVEVTMEGSDITAVTVVSNSETPEIASGALEQIPAAIVEADTADVDIVAGATYTSNGIINAVKNALENAGSSGGGLTGTADGFMGPITVEVTMDGDTITGVTVVSNSETPEIAAGALEQIPEAIVAANSPDVDVVAGATYTSNGIINAVKAAIGA